MRVTQRVRVLLLAAALLCVLLLAPATVDARRVAGSRSMAAPKRAGRELDQLNAEALARASEELHEAEAALPRRPLAAAPRRPSPSLPNPLGPGAFGLDTAFGYNQTVFECLRDKGYSFVVQRIWRSLCIVDDAAVASIDAAWAAGMSQVDVYLYPACACSLKPEQQVSAALAALAGHQFGTLWLDIETFASNWTTPAANLAWVQAAVQEAVSQLGPMRVGIYTNAHNWAAIMNNAPELGNFRLWYAHYETTPNPSFSDFQPFGAWQFPAIKQFADGPEVCGASMDHNWAPQ